MYIKPDRELPEGFKQFNEELEKTVLMTPIGNGIWSPKQGITRAQCQAYFNRRDTYLEASKTYANDQIIRVYIENLIELGYRNIKFTKLGVIPVVILSNGVMNVTLKSKIETNYIKLLLGIEIK